MENSSDKVNKSEPLFVETTEKPDVFATDQTVSNQHDDPAQGETSEEGWQEAVPKGRSLMGRKSSGSRRPGLAKLNTNFMNASHLDKFRGKTNNFISPRTSPNEPAASSTSSAPKKYVKSSSFSPKSSSPTIPAAAAEKFVNPKSSPATPASNAPTKAGQIASSISVQAAGKHFSYKEVALARPGTIVKAVNKLLPNDNSAEGPVQATATSNDGENKQIKSTTEQEKPVDTANEKQQTEEGDTSVIEAIEENQNETSEAKGPEVSQTEGVKSAAESKGVEPEHASLLEGDASDSSNSTTSKAQVFERPDGTNAAASSDVECVTGLADNSTLLHEDASLLTEKVGDKAGELSPTNDSGTASLPSEAQNKDNGTASLSPTDVEKLGDSETGKGTTKKLSAAAPPFNPSTVPVFGSVPVPVFKEHGGILPPPVNIPPMLPVNPVRRSPHQSATARVPYGPRLSGGYNRSGSRVPRNKPAFHSTEHNGDAGPYSPPLVMNPHAAEFVPGQPWVQNGYPVTADIYVSYPNGISVPPSAYPITQNGMPVSPNGSTTSSNGIPVTQNGFQVPSVVSVESASVATVEEDSNSPSEVPTEENSEVLSLNSNAVNSPVAQTQDEPEVSEKSIANESEVDEKAPCQIEQKPADTETTILEIAATTESCSIVVPEEKKTKCWGDYSDSEAETVEVKS